MNNRSITWLARLLQIAVTLAIFSAYPASHQSIGYLFAHGLGGTENQKYHYITEKILLAAYPCHAYNGPEVTSIGHVDASKVVLGQGDDITALGNTVTAIPTDITTLIGFGVSKGAATWINSAAALQPSNLKALVLESPFADANELAYEIGKKNFGLAYIPFGQNLAKFFLGTIQFPQYKADGLQPIATIKHVPNIPIIFVHSLKDTLISINHSRKLYRELIKEGRTNVYLVEVEDGNHANILSQEDWQTKLSYLKPVHAFYKHHGLPYDQELAQDVMLNKYQPSLKEITEKIEPIEQSESFKSSVKLGCAVVVASGVAYKTVWSDKNPK